MYIASIGLILTPPTTLLATSAIANFSETEIIMNTPIESVLNDILFNATFSAIHAAGMTENTLVENESFNSIYEYTNVKRLWIPYGIACGIAVLNIVIGVWAIRRNRAIIENGFLQTIVTTRNGELDALAVNGGIGVIPEELKRAKLMLGRLDGALAFGTKGRVSPST